MIAIQVPAAEVVVGDVLVHKSGATCPVTKVGRDGALHLIVGDGTYLRRRSGTLVKILRSAGTL